MQDVKVAYSQRINSRLLHLGLSFKNPVTFSPGQYLVIHDRAYAIGSPPEAPVLELFVRLPDEDDRSHPLVGLRENEALASVQLSGTGFILPPSTTQIRFLATGTAVSSFRSYLLSRSFVQSTVKAELVHGMRGKEEQVMLKGLQGQSRIHVSHLHSPERLTDYLKRATPAYFNVPCSYGICGQSDFVSEARQLLLSRGVAKDRVFGPN